MAFPGFRRYSSKSVPIGVAEVVAARALEGHPVKLLQEQYGLSAPTVQHIVDAVRNIDLVALSSLKPALEPLQILLATKMTLNSLKTVDSDPQASVRYAFGGKLATEAAKLSAPASMKPGTQIMAFITQLQVLPAPANVRELEMMPVPSDLEGVSEVAEIVDDSPGLSDNPPFCPPGGTDRETTPGVE